ncbi:MAG: DegV family protein [Eubacterium sp.]|nr:DegV family protein [Eubacterium sp.]
MDIIITADSTCDLPDYLVQENDIVIFPLSILLGENSYLDGIEIHPKEIYEHVGKTGELPKTAAVTPQQYTDVFKQITDDGKAVVHIGLSSAISSSYQNAVVAASEFDNVYCVDSKSLCTGMGLLVLKACDLRNKKFDAKKIARRLEGLVSKVHTTFVLDSLEYLHKGGRCSAVARFGANVLGLKPSIAVSTETGRLDVAKKYRGKIDIVYKQYISDCLQNNNKIDKTRVVIANSGGVSPDIIAYAKGIAEGRGFKQIITADAGCTISSHCGPKTLAVFFMEE